MRWWSIPTVVILLSGGARASDPCGCWGLSWPWSTERRPCCSCVDDYCRKPMPVVPPYKYPYCGKDDYCAKPMPVVPLYKYPYCGKDDYCPKPCTMWLPRCYPTWYTCVPTSGCAATATPPPPSVVTTSTPGSSK